MSIDAQLAFGIKLTRKECNDILKKLNTEPDEYCQEEQLADQFNLGCEMFGDAAHGDADRIWYVVGPDLDFYSSFGGPNADANIMADCYALKEMLEKLDDILMELEINPDPEWHLGTLRC